MFLLMSWLFYGENPERTFTSWDCGFRSHFSNWVSLVSVPRNSTLGRFITRRLKTNSFILTFFSLINLDTVCNTLYDEKVYHGEIIHTMRYTGPTSKFPNTFPPPPSPPGQKTILILSIFFFHILF
jgi:hypothetical protein